MVRFLYLSMILLFLGICHILSAGEKDENVNINTVISDKSAETFSREIVDRLAKEDYPFVFNKFDLKMKNALSESKLKELWKNLITQCGSFKSIDSVKITSAVSNSKISEILCRFEKVQLNIKIVLNDKSELSGLWITPVQQQAGTTMPELPVYADSSKFKETEIIVKSGEWSLPGTLLMPSGLKKVPAVVLVHGSGSNDRDETIGPNKPFLDIAFGLASKGIAVIRYVKRTRQYPMEMQKITDFTVKDESIDDAIAAVSLLRKNENIDPDKIYVLGHSLGGMLAPRLGERDPRIAGFIVLAGAVTPLEDLIIQQVSKNAASDGIVSDEENKQIDIIKTQAAKVKSPTLTKKTDSRELPFNAPASYWLDLRGYKPQETAAKLKSAFYILQGANDFQVPVSDFELWKKALKAKRNASFKLYPGLNHLFMASESANSIKEYQIKGHVSKEVIDDIILWINNNSKK